MGSFLKYYENYREILLSALHETVTRLGSVSKWPARTVSWPGLASCWAEALTTSHPRHCCNTAKTLPANYLDIQTLDILTLDIQTL